MVLSHDLLKTWGEFLRYTLALAKWRYRWGYDAVKLSAAYNTPGPAGVGPAGGAWQIRQSKTNYVAAPLHDANYI